MGSDTGQPSFEALLLGVGSLGENELVQVHSFVQELLNKVPSEQLHVRRNVDMKYFEMLRSNRAIGQKVELGSLLKSISALDIEMLVLLDIMIIFLNHKLDLKAALPEIMQKTSYEIEQPRFTEIVFPTFVLPKKS
jgi:hypothetical protein